MRTVLFVDGQHFARQTWWPVVTQSAAWPHRLRTTLPECAEKQSGDPAGPRDSRVE